MNINYYSTQGYYGSNNTPCTIHCAKCIDYDLTWYVVEGSLTVNCSTEPVTLGTNVEELSDVTCFTCGNEPVNSLSDLEDHEETIIYHVEEG